jgi:putative membrane-bound dehydrogenase-like protein
MKRRVRATVAFTSLLFVSFAFGSVVVAAAPDNAERIQVLFLGDNGHHRPAERFKQLQPVLAARGIDVTYTDDVRNMNAKTLGQYDALLVYANIDSIELAAAKALLDYVDGGGGFVPLHCASYCFRNSDEVVALIGAQFRRHGTGVFRTEIASSEHPIMKGFDGFESWDETYVHDKHNETNRTVLEYRIDKEGKEPWTWVRTHGKGRVFYTAWGHDERTWGSAGFQNLVERGIRWAARTDPSVAGEFRDPAAQAAFKVPPLTAKRTDVKPFEYVEAKIAFYPPRGDRSGGGAWNRMQLPLEPAESMKHFVTPVDFEVQLFAAEPQIGKPICMNWDERGRLWIAETVDYPNDLQPPGRGNDLIRICEDTDGDGRADKFTVFADKLSIPTSLTFARGGVIVHQPPQTLFLKDTDGDGRADVRQVLLDGWNTRDTHAGPSNLQYGLDNWIWGMVGYSGFTGTVGGEQHQFSQGFYRFKPDGSKLEFVRSTNNNTWGLGFSEDGLIFGSTANGNPSVYMPVANRYYESVRGWSAERLGGIADSYMFHAPTEKIRQVDWHGGYTAAAGHALYTARSYPQQYWNRTAFVTEPTGHLVGTFILNRDGADVHSTNPFNLLGSDDEWSAPIMAEVGPDGQVWVIDWYNYIVQHNPTPVGFQTGKGNAYATDLRDKKHGRIYRVVYKGASPTSAISLGDATPAQLVEALKSDNMLWRRHAQRLLVERGERDVVPALISLVGDKGVDKIGLNTAAIHALWILQGVGALDGSDAQATAAAVAALRHPSAGVRRNSAAVLPRTNESAAAILDAGLLNDADAQVRLAALLALAEMPPSADAGKAIVAMLQLPGNAGDRWIPDAATSAAAAHDVHFLKALAAGGAAAANNRAALNAAAIVAEHYARGGATVVLPSLITALADGERAVADVVVTGLSKGWPRSAEPISNLPQPSMEKLLANLSPGAKGQLIKLASAWGNKEFEKYAGLLVESLLTATGDDKQTEAQRLDSARQLVAFRNDDSQVVDGLLKIVSPRTPPELAAGIIDALAASQSPAVGPSLVKRFGSLTPSAKTAALRVLLSRAPATRVLLDSIEQGQIHLSELSLDQRQALAAHPDRDISSRAKQLLSRGGGLPDPDRQKVLEELMPLTQVVGDAELGKQVFKQQCAKCHTHNGEGTKIGPDLTGMAVHPKVELLTHLIDPSRSVEGNYRVYRVVTEDGRVLSGLLASETKTSIELYDAEGKKHVVLRDDIEELVASPKSLMPDGFEKQVPPEAIANLLEFLTQRGKFLPLDLRKVATIVSTRGMFYSEDAAAERLIFADWSPKTFDGVPFNLVDPQGDRTANVVMLYGPQGKFPPQMSKSVTLPCNAPAKAIHLLSGVSGWGAKQPRTNGTVSMIVRLHYADGAIEDHPLLDGQHFADYIGRFDVPQSRLAFMLRSQQIRYLAVFPKRPDNIREIELVKGPDQTAPIVMAVTVESP